MWWPVQRISSFQILNCKFTITSYSIIYIIDSQIYISHVRILFSSNEFSYRHSQLAVNSAVTNTCTEQCCSALCCARRGERAAPAAREGSARGAHGAGGRARVGRARATRPRAREVARRRPAVRPICPTVQYEHKQPSCTRTICCSSSTLFVQFGIAWIRVQYSTHHRSLTLISLFELFTVNRRKQEETKRREELIAEFRYYNSIPVQYAVLEYNTNTVQYY